MVGLEIEISCSNYFLVFLKYTKLFILIHVTAVFCALKIKVFGI